MKKHVQILILLSSYSYAFLFYYASLSKLLDFENFQVQLAQSPLLSAYAGIISYLIIIVELIISILLFTSKYRLIGLYGSLFLMTSFSVYIYIILNYSDFIPCSCGGILEKLGWNEHFIFNICFAIIGIIGIFLVEKTKKLNNKKIIVRMISVILMGISIISFLFINSENIIKKENNFIRRYPHHPVIEDRSLDLGVNSYYFAGIDKNEVYLGNNTSPLTLISIDKNFTGIKRHIIKLNGQIPIFKNIQLQIKSPYYYVYDGSVPIIYRGKIGETDAKIVSYQDAYFNRLQVLDSTRFVIRTQSSKSKKQVLGILNIRDFSKLKLHEDFLSKKQKNIFDVDGKLISDDENIYFIYYYKNGILKTDYDLKKIEYQKTIDTTQTSHILVKTMSNGHHKMYAPPQMVNEKATVFRGFLFNQSNLIGKYENRKQWRKNSIVDVYDTNNKKYWGSLYIQHRGKDKLSQMLISNHYMYVLIGHEIVRYRLAQTVLDQLKTGDAENLNLE